MSDRLQEFLVALGYSTKTQWTLAVGVWMSIATWLIGRWWSSTIELTGPLAGLVPVLQNFIQDRYSVVSLLILTSTVLVSVRTYLKDRKRLLQL